MIIYFNTPQLKVKKGPIVEASGIRQQLKLKVSNQGYEREFQ